MWAAKNRGRYDRSALRYPSDLTDDEWALAAALSSGVESGPEPWGVVPLPRRPASPRR